MPKQKHIGNHQFHTFDKGHHLGIFIIMILLTALCYDLKKSNVWSRVQRQKKNYRIDVHVVFE